jgi:hypothetical protein
MFIGETHIEMRARKMIDNIYTLDEVGDERLFGDVTAYRFQSRMCRLVPQQAKVKVDRTDMMTMFELAIHEVTSNEATRAGDQNIHV